jgi:hypothetical protein
MRRSWLHKPFVAGWSPARGMSDATLATGGTESPLIHRYRRPVAPGANAAHEQTAPMLTRDQANALPAVEGFLPEWAVGPLVAGPTR